MLFLIILHEIFPFVMTETKDYINNDFKAIDSNESVLAVQDFFADLHYSHFPVVEESVYIGCIASDDVETFDTEKLVKDYRYTLEGFYARSNMIWLDVMEVFARNHSNIIPVLDDENTYIGYYEMSDIVKFFNETPFLKEPGGIIIVEKDTQNYSMGQIVQIVESNNGRILGSFISDVSGNRIQITIKIALGGMNEIIQTFRRYEYEIISQHQEDSYMTSLKDRSDYLDKYLNI